jgi:DNA-binding CsgD family transcriptional regulator
MQTLLSLVPQMIRAIDRPDFYANIAGAIRGKIGTRAASAYVLHPDGAPELRLQYIPAFALERRALPLDAFQRWAYAYDPFYRHIARTARHGAFSLSEVLTDDSESEIFRREFYDKVEGLDEIAVLVPLTLERTLALYFVRGQGTKPFTDAEIQWVKDLAPVLKECVRLHEAQRDKPLSPVSFNAQWHRALDHFAVSVLTGREHQVMQMTLTGKSAIETAELTGLALGTVKNHRKAIYRKLAVESLSSLMALFLRTAGYANGRDDPLELCTLQNAAGAGPADVKLKPFSPPTRVRTGQPGTSAPGRAARPDA